MVEIIDAQGQYFSDVSPKIGVESRTDFRLMWFGNNKSGPLNTSNLPGTLTRLQQLVEFDGRSFLVNNTKDVYKVERSVLAVPSDCPGILQGDSETGEIMPNPNETFLVTVESSGIRKPLEILIIGKSKEHAEYLAGKRAFFLTYGRVVNPSLETQNITPEEFIKKAKKQIDEGIRQSRYVQGFGDLMEYHREKFGDWDNGVNNWRR